MALDTLEVSSGADWRSWLLRNHNKSLGVWLVFYRRESARSGPTYDEALNAALSFGWIDSIVRKLDDEKYARKFTPRKPWSIWSSQNIDRVNRLKKDGAMTKWGLEAFAKRTSEISLLEKFNAEDVRIPKDLENALRANSKAWSNFERFTPSYRKRYLIWISGAKRPETRKKRIGEAVTLISRNVRALLK